MNSLYLRYLAVSSLACFVGLLTFSIAVGNPFVAIVAAPACLGSFLLFKDNLVSPLPRWLINVLLACAALNFFRIFDAAADQTVSIIGEYLVWLQVLKLFEDRTTRNQGQLLVLSVLLMVSSVLTAVSLVVGIMLVIYAPLMLSWAVLFQMFIGAYRRNAAEAGLSWRSTDSNRPPPPDAVTTRQMQQSRRLVFSGAAVAFVMALVVFVLMPRNVGEGALGEWPNPTIGLETGFSDHIQLGASTGNISESDRPVMNVSIVRLWRNNDDDTVEAPQSSGVFRLRGTVLDTYDVQAGAWLRWDHHKDEPLRTRGLGGRDLVRGVPFATNSIISPRDFGPASDAQLFRVAVEAYGPPDNAVFSLWTPAFITTPPEHRATVYESVADGVMRISLDSRRSVNASVISLAYSVQSVVLPSYQLGDERPAVSLIDPRTEHLVESQRRWLDLASVHRDHPLVDNPFLDDPALAPVRQFALEIARSENISIVPDTDWYASVLPEEDAAKLPPALLEDRAPPTEAAALVRAFERRLSNEYRYTLETEAAPVGVDPIVHFLETRQRGHCEYFAAALAGLCRSVNINARVVVGYVATEPSADGAGFVVRERHAHAWVEAEVAPGLWMTFDPSPLREVQQIHEPRTGVFASIKRLFDSLETAWIRGVVTFDQSNQARVLGMQEDGSFNMPKWLASLFGQRDEDENLFAHAVRSAIAWVVAFLAATGALAALYIAAARLRDLKRRLSKSSSFSTELADHRDVLPAYHDMLQRLDRAGLAKPTGVPPVRHADQLDRLHPGLGEPIRTLANIYYAARFAARPLSERDHQAAARAIERLDAGLAAIRHPQQAASTSQRNAPQQGPRE